LQQLPVKLLEPMTRSAQFWATILPIYFIDFIGIHLGQL
jgi:hypothetical protein